MNILEGELLVHRSLLQLTRDYPSTIPETCNVRVDNLNFTLLDSGVLLIEPEHPNNMDIVISSGIHGNETAPIEICDMLVKAILNKTLAVNNRVLFVIGNPPAMLTGQRFVEENLNRLFCGKHKGKTHYEAKRAEKLELYLTDFFSRSVERCHFDLHTAIRASKYKKFAIYPFQDGRNWNKKYLSFFKHSDITTILLAHQPAGTFSYFSSHHFQANGFTVELGQVKAFGDNDMQSFESIVEQLRCIISGKEMKYSQFNNADFNLFQVVDEVLRYSENEFSLNIASDLANFTQFPVGFQLTTDDNGGYRFRSDKHAIVFPNAQVPVGQRVSLIVEKTTI